MSRTCTRTISSHSLLRNCLHRHECILLFLTRRCQTIYCNLFHKSRNLVGLGASTSWKKIDAAWMGVVDTSASAWLSEGCVRCGRCLAAAVSWQGRGGAGRNQYEDTCGVLRSPRPAATDNIALHADPAYWIHDGSPAASLPLPIYLWPTIDIPFW